jgi:hypothetical protein
MIYLCNGAGEHPALATGASGSCMRELGSVYALRPPRLREVSCETMEVLPPLHFIRESLQTPLRRLHLSSDLIS